jgi:excisionase family DNA binding protein
MQISELETGITIPKLLTLAAVAEALAVSPHTVRMWVRKGRLQPVRLCRRLLFDPAEVARFVSEAR